MDAWPRQPSSRSPSYHKDFPGPGERHLFVNVFDDDCPCDPYNAQFADATDTILALTRIFRPDGDTVRFTYDTAGRPQGVIHQEASLVYGYSAVGNLAAVLAPAESLAFSYDGSLLTGVEWTGPVSGEVTAEYDNDFRVSSLFVNSTFLAQFGYDQDGLLVEAGDLGC
jgi:YD repeat-containing protein